MNKILGILAVLLVIIFLVSCSPNQNTQSGYAAYNQPQGQQGQYVGGGCGVAPNGAYENTPIEALDSADSAL